MHGHHWYPGYYRRGPSRLWWFFLGGAAVAWWNYHTNKPENAHRRFGWCSRREIQERQQQQQQTPVDYAAPAATSQTVTGPFNERSPQGQWGEWRQQTESEPLWKLRGEKERERVEREREMEFRENMLKAREKVCLLHLYYEDLDVNQLPKVLSVTESGLHSLQQSLESLTKVSLNVYSPSSPYLTYFIDDSGPAQGKLA
ncbi:hypothetical protein CPB86DRAFT_189883 [Serendipita vermifera]|nr:hypothetical protein CPB86DRAFT_189883 [Serendipita vermifera]